MWVVVVGYVVDMVVAVVVMVIVVVDGDGDKVGAGDNGVHGGSD